jgi:peptidoglycan hydrolase-like protein with peptidoglycan-binding domain
VITATASEPGARPPAPDAAPGGSSRWPRRAAAAVLVLVVVGLVLAITDPFTGNAHHSANQRAYPTSTATVTQGTLSAGADAPGTLGYAAQPDGSPYSLANRASGVYTSLPAPLQVISQGQPLYAVDYRPVVLLDGSAPAARSLGQGASGPDVQQLNTDLVTLGYAKRSQLDPRSNVFTTSTAAAVSKLQARLGLPQTGSLPLGEVMFLPGPVRITHVGATLGTNAPPGTVIAQATSTVPEIHVNLDAAGQSTIKVGARALITLPDNQITTGVVSRIGAVSGDASGASSSGSSGATIPVFIKLSDPRLAAGLDQAPVQTKITSLTVNNALSVPVTALLARADGRYAVETIDAHGVHHLVPITLGMFDNVDGRVQIVSGHLYPGQRIVVPGT